MGYIFRLPFYLIGIFVWIPLGILISLLNILTLPIFGIVMLVLPSVFPNKAKDILSFGTLRRGVNNLNAFIRG
ncbi:hypothetical protein BEN30_16240 [Magnetovibrio blakemorei]|uniref:Inner membrane component domain-containing protein n=1 Tax=Magnetovibrio blakemorei TaxID=28181 RepID=A0A1E5Q496_9PROT|nr:hypothetical protein BEN30_16240 [Magnetovibrio blakemorei]